MMLQANIQTEQDRPPVLSFAAKPRAKAKFNFTVELASHSCPNRKDIASFVKAGFAKAHSAKVSVSMPYLIALQNGEYKAALGLRSAIEPLFIEQYLQDNIEHHPFFNNEIERQEIAEIGHLYSNAQSFTLPLFLITAVSLYCRNYKYLVFCGTEKVIELIKNSGVEANQLCPADPNLLGPSDDDWGQYYQSNPQVVAISLDEAMSLFQSNRLFQKMFLSLSNQISQVCNLLTLKTNN